MCEIIKPSSWDQGGILRDIVVLTRTVDDAIDESLDSPSKMLQV
jgi:hypothetical protein